MFRTLLVLALLCPAALAGAEGGKTPDPTRWEADIARFEKEDERRPPPKGGVVFTGSSSIAGWKDLDKHFPGVPVLNRGFGGSILPDVNHFLDRTVLKHRPAAVVLYCGGNDLAAFKRTPEQVHADFRTFVKKIHAELPKARVFVLSLHIPPGRVAFADVTTRTNALIAEDCRKDERLAYVDIAPLMQGPDGRPDPALYRDDLHPNAKGYDRWAEKLRPLLKDHAPAQP